MVPARDGIDAQEKLLSDENIDLMISDMNMPYLNGMELIEWVRHSRMDIPIIFLTVNDEISVAVKAMKNGADDYLLKDENIHETLLPAVEQVMEKYLLKKKNMELMQELEQKNKELERMTLLDGLTSIANRRHFDRVLDHEWFHCQRAVSPFSVIIIDIDYFKQFNDTHGHQNGDECLKQVAQTLRTVLKRPADFIARYGGEEFAAILPNTDMSGAVAVAERMRSTVAEMQIQIADSDVCDQITVSIGVSSIVPDPASLNTFFVDSPVARQTFLAEDEL